VVDFNLPGAGYPTIYRDFSEEVDTKMLAERDQILVAMGWEPSEEYIGDTYGEGWTRKTAPAPAERSFDLVGAGFKPAPTTPSFAAADPELHPAPAMTDRLAQDAAPALSDWLGRIRTLVEAAPDLPALRDALLAAYGDLPTADLANVMQLAFAAAELAGRFDADTEARAAAAAA
jgi:hypothetical protein